MRLYFFASSQWGSFSLCAMRSAAMASSTSPFQSRNATAPSLAMASIIGWLGQLPMVTAKLSSALAPSGTMSYGIFGIVSSSLVCASSASDNFTSYSAICALRAPVCALAASASSRLPCAMSAPMDLLILFISAAAASFCCCAALRSASRRSTSSIASAAPAKCFFSKPAITRALSS